MYAASRLAGFDKALESYLEANCSRDLRLLESTTAADTDVCMTLPTGATVAGRDAALRAKERWFSQKQWRMSAHVAWTMETGDAAVAIVDIVYSDADARGLPRDKRFRQVLVFRKDLGEWRALAELA